MNPSQRKFTRGLAVLLALALFPALAHGQDIEASITTEYGSDNPPILLFGQSANVGGVVQADLIRDADQAFRWDDVFGHSKGAFTGASSDRRGLFSLDDRGTLFLDELADLSEVVQPKLLRVLEDGMVYPIGATDPLRCDARLIAATSTDLDQALAAGRFRSDLFYRLSTFTVTLPSLRNRIDDLDCWWNTLRIWFARAAIRTSGE